MDRNQSHPQMGGEYRIVAAQRGQPGLSADLLIVDELREFEDFDFIAAAAPTIFASANPQILYLSNAGTERTVVLNDLKQRADSRGSHTWSGLLLHTGQPTTTKDGWKQTLPLATATRPLSDCSLCTRSTRTAHSWQCLRLSTYAAG